MKHKEPIALFLIGALLSGIVTVGASEAGSAADPLIALNWLKETFIPGAVSEAEKETDEKLGQVGDDIISSITQGSELRVKRGDVLRLSSGSSLVPLAGDLTIAADSKGAVIDLSEGAEASVGSSATADHRYLAAEDSQIAFLVASDTGVVRVSGPYELSASAEIDYNAIAEALYKLGLFRGNDVPYGSGYDLESAPTRIQGLVMFLRLLGEEQYALSYSEGSASFADVPDWALPYVAYAYAKGYTKGQEINSQGQVVFGSEQLLASRDYMTFLLRALGHSEGVDFTWETAVSDAQALGVLTAEESRFLTEKPFLRAQVAYLSYLSLSTPMVGEEGTILDRLISMGAISATAADAVLENIIGQRI